MKRGYFRPLDILIYGVIAISLCFFALNLQEGEGELYHLQVMGESYYYPLDYNQVVKLEGVLGTIEISFSEEGAFFLDSSCPGKNCLKGKALHRTGQWRACLPNQVLLSVESKEKTKPEGLDAVAF